MDLAMAPYSYTIIYPRVWAESGYNYDVFFSKLYLAHEIDLDTYQYEMNWVGAVTKPEEGVPAEVPTTGAPIIIPTEQPTGAPAAPTPIPAPTGVGGKLTGYFRDAFDQVLKSFWNWLKTQLSDFFEYIWELLKPKLTEVWDWTKAKLEEAGRDLYGYISRALDSVGIVTPDRAVVLALELYTFAMSAGVAAHFTSVLTELLHPMKNLGISQVAGMIGDFAGFGRISGATIGVLESRILGQAMTYAFQYKHRPVVPDVFTIRELAVKGDIDKPKFRRLLGYHGLSDEYIDDIDRTMYREPNYRELGLMYESADGGDIWLHEKLRRAGYDESDARILTESLAKRVTSSHRSTYFNQCFYLYREGYIEKERFVNMLTWLGLRREAVELATVAADLAYLYDYTKDVVTYYTNSYLKDLISEDELLISLISVGVVPDRALLLVRKARVQKTPKPTTRVTKPAAAKLTQLQTRYVQLYVQQYRKDLITSAQLLANLLALGLSADLAEVTVALEVTRGLKVVSAPPALPASP